jgi:hypothetical protein
MPRTAKDPVIMLDPMSVVRTFQMPNHPTQGKRDGTTSMFLKHTDAFHMVLDYKMLSLAGQPMPKSQFKSKLADLIRTVPGYGKRGGSDYATHQAGLVISAMIKEGHIVVF